MDGRDVLKLCDYNIAYEVRLLDAVARDWLTPFQYFAVYDKTDYEQIKWSGTRYDENQLTMALNNAARMEVVAKNLQKYLPSRGKIKAVAFCSSVAHAGYAAKQLTEHHQIPAIALTGSHSNQERLKAIGRLQNEHDNLQIICTVDIFNEGIDIPELTHVLLLRPTQSFTVFLQQLGRGLRKAPDKEYLVVIDFVGNFKKVHVAPLALAGYNSTEAFRQTSGTTSLNLILKNLPDNCYLNPDIEVQRIWDREIKQLMAPATTEARLKFLYLEIKENLGIDDPSLYSFFQEMPRYQLFFCQAVSCLFRAWSQYGPPVTVGGPMGSGLCYCAFDNHLCFKVNFNKSANNASLTPPQSGPCCDQALFFYVNL